MNRKLALGIAVGVLILAVLACGPTSPTAAPTSGPQPTGRPTVAPTQQGGGGGEEGGGKGGAAEPTPTPPGSGDPGGGKGGSGSSTDRPATLTLVNSSSSAVCYIYISLSTESTWGDDWLGASETISSGDSREFEVAAGTYDLRAADCNRNTLDERYGVSIAGALIWTVAGTGGQPGSVTVTLRNNSGQTVCYVYISPSTSSEWGDDWLGSDTVGDGSSYSFNVAVGSYDFKAEDCSHNVMDSQFGIALSSNWNWTINPISSGSATLTVYNNSGTSIYYFYISPSTSSSWGDDQLGSSTIAAGGSYTFNVTEGTYDLKAEDSSHNVIATQFGFYISGAASWTVTGGGTGSATVNLVNNSGQTVCYVYISPSTSSSWGSDWLGSDVLPAGESRTFSLAAGTYDLKAEDCSHNTIATEFQQNISGDTTWTLQ
jgi:hypothetical protein